MSYLDDDFKQDEDLDDEDLETNDDLDGPLEEPLIPEEDDDFTGDDDEVL